MKKWEKKFHANFKQKKAGMAIILSDKIEYKSTTVKIQKEYYVLRNVWNH